MTPEEIELRRRMAEALAQARALHTAAENENRNLSAGEQSTYDQHMAAFRDLEARADRARAHSVDTTGSTGGEQEPGHGTSGGDGGEQRGGGPTLHGVVEQLLASDELRSARSQGYRGGFALPTLEGLSLRALIDGTTLTSGGALQNPTRLGRIPVAVPDRMLTLLDLLPHGNTGDNSVEYVRDTTTDAAGNTAVEVAEGNLKPETTGTYEIVNDPVKTIPAWLDVTRQSLDDNGQLRTNLEERLRYRAMRRLDAQVINGDGVGANLLGLLNRTGILGYAPATAERRIESVRRAITIGEQNEVMYTTVVVNPLDKERYDLTVAAGSGEYLSATAPSYMWGLTPVVSNAIAAGTAMLLDPNEAMIWDRADAAIYVTDSDADKFRRNILTMLVDLRAALSLFVPRAVCKDTFNGTT